MKGFTMTPPTILGVVLISLGIVAFMYQGITYTTQNKIIELGPLQATVEKQETIPLSPFLGGLALAGGVTLLLVGARKS
jgi:hypothetical protein